MLSALASTFQHFMREFAPAGNLNDPSLPPTTRRSPITMAFTPTPADVQDARLLLHRGVGLPVELVDLILDAARYWPIAANTTTTPVRDALSRQDDWGAGRNGRRGRDDGVFVVKASSTGMNKAAQLVAVTDAVPVDGGDDGRLKVRGLRKVQVRSVRWWLRSRDQGWAGGGNATNGTYIGSSSWFDACILRPLAPSDPSRPAMTGELAARIEQLIQRSGLPPPSSFVSSSSSSSLQTISPTYLVGTYRSVDPEEVRSLLRALGWDFVERVERVEIDGEVGERRSMLWKLQANLVAGSEFRVHRGEWWRTGERERWRSGDDDDDDGELEEELNEGSGDGVGFVDTLRPGDRVGVWARAMFPGWENHVDDVKVEIRYSV